MPRHDYRILLLRASRSIPGARTTSLEAWRSPANKRDARLPDTPTIHELMDQYKTTDQARRVATVILAGGVFGRPPARLLAIPADRLKILRAAAMSALNDPELKAGSREKETTNWIR